ncbi:hypothetical protein D3C72_2032400 [compost metagenome]
MDVASKRLHDLAGLQFFLIHFGPHLVEQLELLEASLEHKEDRRLRRDDLLRRMEKGVSVAFQDGVDGIVGGDRAGIADNGENVVFFDHVRATAIERELTDFIARSDTVAAERFYQPLPRSRRDAQIVCG